jgi:hypothetical protein
MTHRQWDGVTDDAALISPALISFDACLLTSNLFHPNNNNKWREGTNRTTNGGRGLALCRELNLTGIEWCRGIHSFPAGIKSARGLDPLQPNIA